MENSSPYSPTNLEIRLIESLRIADRYDSTAPTSWELLKAAVVCPCSNSHRLSRIGDGRRELGVALRGDRRHAGKSSSAPSVLPANLLFGAEQREQFPQCIDVVDDDLLVEDADVLPLAKLCHTAFHGVDIEPGARRQLER